MGSPDASKKKLAPIMGSVTLQNCQGDTSGGKKCLSPQGCPCSDLQGLLRGVDTKSGLCSLHLTESSNAWAQTALMVSGDNSQEIPALAGPELPQVGFGPSLHTRNGL